MIDPVYITNFNRTIPELEELWIFCILVAGKNAKRTARAVDAFLKLESGRAKPFSKIQRMINDGTLIKNLKIVGAGQYSRISRALQESLSLNLKTATIDELEAIHGIGEKTSRFFVLHSRKNVELAVLDTHLKRYVVDQGRWNVIRGQGSWYKQIEQVVLEMAKEKKMTPADFDLFIWRKYSGNEPRKELA
jgi:thermostable 8-oxoguanine DNA glycosylase